MRTVAVDKSKYAVYIQKAEEYKRSMDLAFGKSDWDSCAGNAVHCAISSADALCILALGLRHKGERHEDAIELFRSINSQDDRIKKNASRLAELLSIKTDAEYGDRLLSGREAEIAVLSASRLFEFVKERISEIVDK